MTILADTVLGDTWRIGVTLLALLIIGAFWYFVVSNITPFSSRPATDESEDAGPKRKYPQLRPSAYPKVQKWSVTADVVLFIWIVLEGVVLVPLMLIKYGLH